MIASDGINRLKDIEFDLASAYTTPKSVLKIIYDILSYCNTSQFWGSSDIYIKTSSKWYDTQQTLQRVCRGTDTWYFDTGFLTDTGQGDVSKAVSSTDPKLKCKDLLMQILTLWGLRLKLSAGSWHIQQISETSATYTYAKYDKTLTYFGTYQLISNTVIGTITSAGTVYVYIDYTGEAWTPKTLNPTVSLSDTATDVATKIRTALNADSDISNFFVIGGTGAAVTLERKKDDSNSTSTFTIANGSCAGLTLTQGTTIVNGTNGTATANYQVTHNGTTLAVADGGIFGHYPALLKAKAGIYPSDILNRVLPINSYINGTTTTYTGSTITLGSMYGNLSKLFINLIIYYDLLTWHAVLGEFVKIKLTVTVTAGNYRIKNSNGRATWTTTAADKYIDYIEFSSVYDGKLNLYLLEFEEIPFVKEVMTIKLEFEFVKSSGSVSSPTVAQFNTYFKYAELRLYDYSGSTPKTGQLVLEELINPVGIENSIERDYGMMRIHDNGAIASTNIIEVKTSEVLSYSSNNVNISALWNASHNTNEGLVYTFLREALILQKYCIRKYTGTFITSITEVWNSIYYDSVLWVFQGGRHNLCEDIINGEWFGIIYIPSAFVPTENKRVNDIPTKKFTAPNYGKPTTKVKGGDIPYKGTKNDKTTAGSAMSTINTDTIMWDVFREGDILYMINPVNKDILETATVSQDVEAGSTSIAVVSFTTSNDIYPQTVLMFDIDDIQATKNLRATESILLGKINKYSINKILYVDTTDLTSHELTLDGATASSSNIIILREGEAMGCMVDITVKELSGAECGYYSRRFLIKNNNNTTSIEGTVQTIGTDIESGLLVGSTITITANDTDEAIKIDVQSAGALNLRWVANVQMIVSRYT